MENEFLDNKLVKSFQQSKSQAKKLILSFQKCLSTKEDLKSTLYKLQTHHSKISQINQSLTKQSFAYSAQSCKIQEQFSKQLQIHKETCAKLLKLRENLILNQEKHQQIIKYNQYLKSDEQLISSRLFPFQNQSPIKAQVNSLLNKHELSLQQFKKRKQVISNQENYLNLLNGMHKQTICKIQKTNLAVEKETSLNSSLSLQVQQKQQQQSNLLKNYSQINIELTRITEDIKDEKHLNSLLLEKHKILNDKIADLLQSAHKLSEMKQKMILNKRIFQKEDQCIHDDWLSIKTPLGFSVEYAKHRFFKIK